MMAVGFGDEEEELAQVSRLRAEPPGLAATDPERRAVLSASLHQFEELLLAAGRSGPASSPIPLFYAMSQSGRAIAAARYKGAGWNYKGHGLSVSEDQSDLARTVILPQPGRSAGDAFSVVSEAVGSPALSSSCQLGRLWASVPEVEAVPAITGNHPQAILLNPAGSSVAVMARLDIQEASLPRSEWQAAVEVLLLDYPRAGRVEVRGVDVDPTGRPLGLLAAFPGDEDGVFRLTSDLGEDLWEPEIRYLRPAVNDAGDLPTIFMSWWAILLALSTYARYVPSVWYQALSRDTSPLAVPLERVLRDARRSMPRLVRHALMGEWL
jgi:hypothetical protein